MFTHESPVKGVVSDFFNVVVEDHQALVLAENGFTRSGPFAEASDLLDTGAIKYAEYKARFAHHLGMSVEELEVAFAAASLDEGVVALYEELGVYGVPVDLLTNTCSEEVTPIFERHNLPRLFGNIIVSADVGLRKPDPDIYRLALAKLGLKAHQVLFVDDNKDNVAAAQQIGMGGHVFTDATSLRTELIEHGLLPGAPILGKKALVPVGAVSY